MEWDNMTHITPQHDGMAQHGMAWDNMMHITTAQHDGIAQHGMACMGLHGMHHEIA
jgi:hypothetical protein